MRYTIEQQRQGELDVYVLLDHDNGAEARICPELGCNCYALILPRPDGSMLHVIDDTADVEKLREFPSRYGSPILFPWVSRIPTGEYSFAGQQYRAIELGPGDDAWHGLVRTRAWSVDSVTANNRGAELICEISTASHPAMLESFPFPFCLRLIHRLDSTGYRVTAEATNTGSTAMPFGFGFHPYFCVPLSPDGRRDEMLLTIEARSQWNWPVLGEAKAAAPFDNGTAKLPNRDGGIIALGSADFNHGFTDLALLDERVEGWLVDPQADLAIVVSANKDFRTIVFYTPAGRDRACIEPWTCTANCFNLAAAGYPESGMQILQAGQTWSGDMHIGLAISAAP